MKKVIIIIAILLILIVGSGFFLAFTQGGNDIVRPYLQKYISQKIQKNVNIEKFTLSTSHVSLQASIQNEATLIADGDLKLFDQWFDILYHIQAKNLKAENMIIKQKLEIDGQIKGFLDDFIAIGKGEAFSSHVDFNINLIDKKPQSGHIDAKGINVAQVLEFLGKKAYSNGLIDIKANIKENNFILTGNADIIIHKNILNEKLIAHDFNISLPKNTYVLGVISGKVQNDTLNAQTQINSNLATLKAKDTNFNIKSQEIKSDFTLQVADLSKLQFLTKQKLFGSLSINGDVKKNANNLQVNAKSEIFDGLVLAKLNNNNFFAKASNLQIKQILALLGKPAMSFGIINAQANIDDISTLTKDGTLKLEILNGELVGSHVRAQLGENFPAIVNFNGNLNSNFSTDNVQADVEFKSTLGNIKTTKTTFLPKTQELSSDFYINIQNLNQIGKIINQNLNGQLNLNGDVEFSDKQLSFNAKTTSFGGNLEASLKDDKLQAKLKDVLVENILYVLNQPAFAKGHMNMNADFTGISSNKINGILNYTLNDGLILKDGFEKLSNSKIPNDIPFAIKSDLDIKNSHASFTNMVNSELISIPEFKGTYDINQKILNSTYNLNIKDLSKLAFLTKQTLHGQFMAKGIVEYKNDTLKATAKAPMLGGNTNSVFIKDTLHVKAQDISTKGLFDLLDFPYVFNSDANATFNYNISSKKGSYDMILQDGHMVQNQLTDLVKTFTQHDMTQEAFKYTTLNGKIDDTKATYILDLNGTSTKINIPNGTYDMISGKTQADFTLNFQKTDLKGSISGDIKAPKIHIKSSDYLEKKVSKTLDKHLNDKQKQKLKNILDLF